MKRILSSINGALFAEKTFNDPNSKTGNLKDKISLRKKHNHIRRKKESEEFFSKIKYNVPAASKKVHNNF